MEDVASAPYEDMGATALSFEDPDSPTRPVEIDEKWQVLYVHVESRRNALYSWRWSWWAHWNILAEFFKPRRHHWFITANTMNRGLPLNDQIIDSTGALAVNVCASGMWTGLTSPSRPWFELNAPEGYSVDEDGQAWLENVQALVYKVLAKSNFYTTMAQGFEDVTVFGSAPVIIYEDNTDIIRCYLPCAGEYFLAAGARFSVDTLYREFTMTVSQIIEMFGVDNCPEGVTKLWVTAGGSLENEFVVVHAIEPNFPLAKPGKAGGKINPVPGGFSYREVYWIRGEKADRPLSLRGFRSSPFMVARWSRVSNDAYGRSPCMDAIGDNKQVQQETRRKAEFIDKGVRPPMGANPELKNEPASIIPGMITYTSTDGGKKGFWPLFEPNPVWLAGLTADIDKINARIEKCLFVNLFMAISQMEGVQPRNEMELTKRDLERLQQLGPFIHLFETEFAGPAIHRVLDILARRRMLPPIPSSLKNVPMNIEYTSILKMAQRASESVAMKDFFVTMGELSSAAKASGVPDPLRVVDLDKSARRYGDLTNFPQDCLFTDEEVKQHDMIRKNAMQQAQAPQQAMAAVDAAKTLSETNLGGGSALGAILGQGGAAPGVGP